MGAPIIPYDSNGAQRNSSKKVVNTLGVITKTFFVVRWLYCKIIAGIIWIHRTIHDSVETITVPNASPPEVRRIRILWGWPLSDFVVGVGFALAFLICIVFLTGGYERYLPQYAQSHFKQIENPLYDNQTVDLTVNLLSRSFGAQSPIEAYVKVEQRPLDTSHNRLKNLVIPNSYNIGFEGTSCFHFGDIYDRIYPCWMKLSNSTDSEPYDLEYVGNMTLFYAYGDKFDVYLYHESIEIVNATTVGEPFIVIEPLQTTNSFVLFRVAAVIGISAGAIGFLNWYWRYRAHVLGRT